MLMRKNVNNDISKGLPLAIYVLVFHNEQNMVKNHCMYKADQLAILGGTTVIAS